MKSYQFGLIFSLLITFTISRSVKFGLVAFGTKVKVKINDTAYTMTRPNIKDPYFTLTKDVSDDELIYKYEVDNIEEIFDRVLPAGETTTHNEFYGRKDTVKQLPEFDYPNKGSWKKSIGKTSLFDDSYIPTVHIYGTNANNTFTNATASIVKRVAFILKDDVIIIKNPALYTKNRNWDKFQFRLVMNYINNDTSGVYGRYILKFRDNNEDPTFFRQKLYSDIMNTIGAPTIQTIFARVYVNNIPVGLYVIQEEAASESFVRSAFHGDNNGKLLIEDNNNLGHPLDCSTGADFEYNATSTYGAFKPYNSTRYDNSKIKNLIKAFSQLDVNNDSAVEKFDKEWFDIDSFFKAIAMEYLTGHWDSYWFYSTNFAMYDDPTESTATTDKFYFICQDWDGTFGLNLGMPYTRYEEEFTTISYKRYVNIDWKIDNYDAPHRYAIDKFLSNPKLQARFEKILTDIVKYIMNPIDFNKRLDAFVERFRDEVEFTFNVTPWRKGTETIKWTMDDFDRNIKYKGKYGASYGLKEYVYKRASFINKEFNLGLDLGENVYENIKECGPDFGKCSSDKCCSKYGYCGNTEGHCNLSSGCQVGYGLCNEDSTKTTSTVTNVIENVASTSTNTKVTTLLTTTNIISSVETISSDGLCGPGHGICPNNECCSKWGYCGSDDSYCSNECKSEYGRCSNATPTVTTKKNTTKKAKNTTANVTKKSTAAKKNGSISTVSGRCGSEFGGSCAKSVVKKKKIKNVNSLD
ncbi:coth protein-domain-containing protein [Neocallimastix sp. 'constans']